MSVSKKQCIRNCVTTFTVAFVAVTLFCLVVVSSRHFSNCLAPVVADIKTASRDTDTWTPRRIRSSNICTFDAFRNYYKTTNYFPGEGHWDVRTRHHDNVTSTSYRFVPDLCKFRFDGFQSLPGVNVRRCLRRRNVTRITVVGDSNAARYYAALLKTLTGDSSDWSCDILTSEAIEHTMLIPDVRYFARHDRRLLALLRATVRHCSSCVSRVDRCRRQTSDGHSAAEGGGDEDSLWLEHVSMVSVLDSSLKIDVPHNHFVVNLLYRADTFQEFLFKYYLRGRYPDLLIIFPPFNHDKNAETTSSLSIRLQYFLSLMDLYVPEDVQVIWVPSFAEFESHKPPAWANRRSHGFLATNKLDAFNRLLYAQLRHRLVNDSSLTYGFMDLVRVSTERHAWSLDGIHMDPQWYRLISSYLLQLYCGPDIF